ncbi:MAG: helix-turn-helix domain-containing protein, partial [Neisseriaceae bacterium]|nr:helix-turn-helix domain-containing protein [Neisseriaceae bacterium]
MEYTVQEVADLVGKTRQTIYSYLDSGKISFTLSDNNTKLINASEVLRVFPEVASKIAHIEKEKININVDLKVLELEQELTNKLNEIEQIDAAFPLLGVSQEKG